MAKRCHPKDRCFRMKVLPLVYHSALQSKQEIETSRTQKRNIINNWDQKVPLQTVGRSRWAHTQASSAGAATDEGQIRSEGIDSVIIRYQQIPATVSLGDRGWGELKNSGQLPSAKAWDTKRKENPMAGAEWGSQGQHLVDKKQLKNRNIKSETTDASICYHKSLSCFMRPRSCPLWLCHELSQRHRSVYVNKRENLAAARFLCIVYRSHGTERFDLSHDRSLNFWVKREEPKLSIYLFTFKKENFGLTKYR